MATTPDRDAILEDALMITGPQARAEYVRRACGNDEALRRELERLLRLQQELGQSFLEEPPDVTFARSFAAGERLGRYQIEQEIGCGGAGRVYRGRDLQIGREVAVKVMHPGASDEAKRRFLRELRTLGSLNHEHVVHLYDFGEHAGELYLVMEFLHGRDLAAALQQGNCGDLAARIEIGRQTIAGLAHIHSMGIVHRDLKPANLFLLPHGRVKLMDFGVARRVGRSLHNSTTGITMPGLISGTPGYMSPEQIRGEPLTPASDVFSLGLTLYELFTGQPAFRGMLGELWQRILEEEIPVTLLRVCVPAPLLVFLQRCTAKDPAQRPVDIEREYAEAAANPTPTPTPITDEERRQMEAALARSLGALARPLVTRLLRQYTERRQLIAAAAEQIPDAAARHVFLQAFSSAPDACQALVEPELVELARKRLAQDIGPIASVLVKRVARQAASREAFLAALAQEIPSEAARARFLACFPTRSADKK